MSEVLTPRAPMGGTELICNNLKAALPELTDQVQIIMSRPEQYTLDPLKPKILWLQDLPQDPASACLREESYRSQFNRIVFASNWQQQMYNLFLGVPFSQGMVLKNAVPHMEPILSPGANFRERTDGEKLQFIYTSTPHRGLQLLAAATDVLAAERQDWELHVYSSFKIYGWDDQDKQMQPLYDRLQKNPCVIYHGSVPNADVREAVRKAHVFVYPSVYQETSCMAIQEAMMVGCLAITSSLGALIETCGDWAWMFPFSENAEAMASYTYHYMKRALDQWNNPAVQHTLAGQSQYYQKYYSFESRVPAWKTVLEQCIAEGPREEKLIFSF